MRAHDTPDGLAGACSIAGHRALGGAEITSASFTPATTA